MDDNSIIELFNARSEDAVSALSEQYGALCRKTAGNILNDGRDIEECLNDTFLCIWNQIPPERPSSLKAFICRIVKNTALKRLERESALKRKGNYGECIDELKECLPSGDNIEKTVEDKELAGEIESFLDTLKKQDRIIFVRRYWFMDGYELLADKTGLKENALRTRLTRIRKRLRLYLEKRGYLL